MNTVCPHLGVPGDQEVHYGYPNVMNVCYADTSGWSEFEPIDLSRQRMNCLTGNYLLCPIHLGQMSGKNGGGRKRRARTYLEHFGLREEPFSIVPQPRFMVESENQRLAHAGLRWLIDRRQGLGLLFGPVGTGKTLLCHSLAQELGSDPQNVVALLLTPSHRTEYALMADVLTRWKVKPARRRSLRDLEAAAHYFLAQRVLHQKKTVILIIDEAQTLERKQLQQICKMLNWQDGGKQLLQVILAGQPGLQGQVSRVPALRDRAVVEFVLTPMALADMQEMIAKRLKEAGRRGDLFARSAQQLIYQQTAGMPRRVTILCLRSMWMAYQQGERFISKELVQTVIDQHNAGDLYATPGEAAAPLAAGLPSPTGQAPPNWLPSPLQRLWVRVAT